MIIQQRSLKNSGQYDYFNGKDASTSVGLKTENHSENFPSKN